MPPVKVSSSDQRALPLRSAACCCTDVLSLMGLPTSCHLYRLYQLVVTSLECCEDPLINGTLKR